MSSFRQFYALMPWWAGLPVAAMAALTMTVVGFAHFAILACMAGIAATLVMTWNKYRNRDKDRVARIVYFANPERAGEERLFDLILGQIWLGFFAIVVFAAVGAALLGPFGALLPAGVLAARNLLDDGRNRNDGTRSKPAAGLAVAAAQG